MRRRTIIIFAALAVVLAILASGILPSSSHYDHSARWNERQAEEAIREFPALSQSEAEQLKARLASAQTQQEFGARASDERRQYISRMIQRKLSGEPLAKDHYEGLLRLIETYPTDVAPSDLRALLKGTSESKDRDTYITCLRAMGASENVQYIPDVRAQLYNYWALKPYGKLAKSNAIADLLPRDDLETYRLAGPQSVLAEERFEALGMTGDPDLLPILNQIGERQQVHRKAVERALSWIDDPGAVTVAANMLSLPTDYPNEHIPDEGRWHSNEHSAARNVLLEGAKKRGVPPPKSLGQQDLQVWWESNRSQFPSIESIRAAFPEKRNKLLRRSPPTPAN